MIVNRGDGYWTVVCSTSNRSHSEEAERAMGDTTSGSSESSVSTVRLAASRLSKRYGAHLALRDVGFVIGRSEIVAVVGENGAGKSTLSKILGGAIRPDSGSLRLDGETLHLGSPRDALRVGISY